MYVIHVDFSDSTLGIRVQDSFEISISGFQPVQVSEMDLSSTAPASNRALSAQNLDISTNRGPLTRLEAL